jgi:hypothetical protein
VVGDDRHGVWCDAASATASCLSSLEPSAANIARADVHGYTTAFAWSAALFAVGAVVAAVLYKGGVPATESAQTAERTAEPVLAQ